MPGSVTAFGIINDTDNQVSLILDARLMENEIINCHPLRNTATTSIAAEDLKKFVTATDHALQIIALDEKPTS